jgi:hypothetical protein
MQATPDVGVVRDFPLAPNRAADLTLRTLADVYMANFAGRDGSRSYTVAFWVTALGEQRRLVDLDADAIADVLDHLAATPVTKFVGKDAATGEKILRSFARRRAPATINRLKSDISSMLSFAQRRRRGEGNPGRSESL